MKVSIPLPQTNQCHFCCLPLKHTPCGAYIIIIIIISDVTRLPPPTLPPAGEWQAVAVRGVVPGARHVHTAVEYEGAMWVFGGYGSSSTYYNDTHRFSLGTPPPPPTTTHRPAPRPRLLHLLWSTPAHRPRRVACVMCVMFGARGVAYAGGVRAQRSTSGSACWRQGARTRRWVGIRTWPWCTRTPCTCSGASPAPRATQNSTTSTASPSVNTPAPAPTRDLSP